MRIFLAFIFAILAIPCALAQENSIDSSASQMAKAISHSKQKSVVVFDFVGPDQKLNALGQKIADDFSSALARSRAKLTVQDCPQVREAVKKNFLAPNAIRNFDAALVLARILKTQAFITGNLSIKNSELVVETASFRASNGDQIERVQVILPLTQEMDALMSKTIEEKQEDAFASFPQAGKDGYSSLSCVHCPPRAIQP